MVIVAAVIIGVLVVCGAVFVLICGGSGRRDIGRSSTTRGDQLSPLDQMDGVGESAEVHHRRAA